MKATFKRTTISPLHAYDWKSNTGRKWRAVRYYPEDGARWYYSVTEVDANGETIDAFGADNLADAENLIKLELCLASIVSRKQREAK